MRIAILGATGHIALNLIDNLGRSADMRMELFARSTTRVRESLDYIGYPARQARVWNLAEFVGFTEQLDTIVNCVGFGTPEKVGSAGNEIFLVTEKFDNAAMEEAARHSGCVYINFSSGAVFGRLRSTPVSEGEEFRVRVDKLAVTDAYSVAKLNSEAKHRATPELQIIDLRVFSFFSRYIDLSSQFLVVEMARSIREGVVFETTRDDLVRDFVAPSDLGALIGACAVSHGINGGFDVYSRAPIRKQELLEAFVERYGMKLRYSENDSFTSPTGKKDQYYSLNRRAEACFGYSPRFSSLEAVLAETDAILGRRIG